MALFEQHDEDDLTRRGQRVARPLGDDSEPRPDDLAQAADLDAQPDAVGFVQAARARNARTIRVCRGTLSGHASASTRSTSKRTGLRASGMHSPEERTSRPPPSMTTSAERPSAQISQNDAVRALPRVVTTTVGPS